jgi:hypothetical protein
VTVLTEKLGPGLLTLGSGPLAVEQQLTGCKLVAAENVTTEEAIKVVSGEEIPEETSETFTWTLQGEFLQSLVTAGVVAWSWANKGAEFEPNSGGASFAGTLKPVPLQVGGDEVDKRMKSTFTWRVVGDPTPTWA